MFRSAFAFIKLFAISSVAFFLLAPQVVSLPISVQHLTSNLPTHIYSLRVTGDYSMRLNREVIISPVALFPRPRLREVVIIPVDLKWTYLFEEDFFDEDLFFDIERKAKASRRLNSSV